MDKIVLVGGGGHAASVLDTLLSSNSHNVIGITDSNAKSGSDLLGIHYIGDDNALQAIYDSGVKNAVIAIGSLGDTSIRRKLYNLVKNIGFNLPTIIDPTAIIGRGCKIDEGVFIGKGAVINTLSRIDKMAIVNSTAVLEHQCKIGAFSHVAPGCILGGNVTIGEHTHIGIGTTIIQGIDIGDRVLIGAGSTVVKNMRSGIKAYGSPCREVENL